MSAKNKKTILLLLVAAVLLAVVPFFAKKGAEFGGSDGFCKGDSTYDTEQGYDRGSALPEFRTACDSGC